MSDEKKEKYEPQLQDLENFEYSHRKMAWCERCMKRTGHEVYDGHTFAEASKLEHCLECGRRELR